MRSYHMELIKSLIAVPVRGGSDETAHLACAVRIYAIYEGGIKSNATNDVKWQLKVGLHFCLSQTFKVPSFYRYKKFKFLIQSLKAFS